MASFATKGIHVSGLFIYPIKSLREISLKDAQLTPQGLENDRRFMLRQIKDDGSRRNMAVYHDPLMCRFVPEIGDGPDSFKVTFSPTDGGDRTHITIPFAPDVSQLTETPIAMHGSPTNGFDMGSKYNSWFSECFGFDVELIYVGQNRRKVFGNVSPNGGWRSENDTRSWSQTIANVPVLGSVMGSGTENDHEQGLGLSDVAAVLVVSDRSLDHIQRLLPEDVPADITKFRPNIIVGGVEDEYVEDFWRELDIQGNTVLLTQNCNRCVSLDVDYETGAFGKGLPGKVRANLAKERRVDPGAKYSPVFGRYGFFEKNSHGQTISVGDSVAVTKVNQERTSFYWPYKVPS